MMQKNDTAVSPVIGVMLMLVVTIIIAALVSAFSGSAVSGNHKTTQAIVQGTYSQTNGMVITNNGGDAIPLETTTIVVQPSESFGSNASRYSWTVNKDYVFSRSGKTWTTTKAFLPGDTATITKDNLTYVQLRPDLTSDANDLNLGFANEANVGLTFDLVFLNAGGKPIGQCTVTIAR